MAGNGWKSISIREFDLALAQTVVENSGGYFNSPSELISFLLRMSVPHDVLTRMMQAQQQGIPGVNVSIQQVPRLPPRGARDEP